MDKTKDGFNKLQWSQFVGDSQYVVRCNDMAEFIKLIGAVNDFVKKQPKTDAVAPGTPPPQQTTIPTAMKSKPCDIHGVAMYEKTGAYGPYFSHYDKEQGYCNGRGFKAKAYKKY